MSSGCLLSPPSTDLFWWDEVLPVHEYAFATYAITAHCDPRAAAVGMAMEQSTSTGMIAGHVTPAQVRAWTIRVVSVTPAPSSPSRSASGVRRYGLDTDVYAELTSQVHSLQVVLAVPKRLLRRSYVHWLNVLIGELPRLGFLSAIRLLTVQGLDDWQPGPGFGVTGIRARLGVKQGPILCRAMRPAIGLDTATMARLNEAVLRGGFHVVKDDELTTFDSNAAFEHHVQAMVACRDQVQHDSGERKSYLATLICEPSEFEQRWNICCRYGVDGVLLAPFIQGVALLAEVAGRKQFPILAHNTGSEILTRHPDWGVSEAAWQTLLRQAGADWLVTSGGFGDEVQPDAEQLAALHAMTTNAYYPTVMPILQGGKQPSRLAQYTRTVGSADYMLIVATWADGHPQGLEAGARLFRQAVETSETTGPDQHIGDIKFDGIESYLKI